MAVDAEENIYVGTNSAIWSFSADGSQRWKSDAINVSERGSFAIDGTTLYAGLKPCAYELVYKTDDEVAYPKELRSALSGKALIWYNTLWDTLCGGHDYDLALEDPDAAFGFLIDTLGARIIQTDRSELLLKYLKSRKLHE